MAIMWHDDPGLEPAHGWRRLAQFCGEVLMLAAALLMLFYVLPLLVVR